MFRHVLVLTTLLTLTGGASAEAATFTVTSSANSGIGTFRQAITDANANPGGDAIAFSIGSGAQTIQPTSALPVITSPVAIDATTQPGYVGTPLITLNGSSMGTFDVALEFASGAATSALRGLRVVQANLTGVVVRADDVSISDCTVDGSDGGGIVLNQADEVSIAGCTVEGNDGNGIGLNQADDAEIGASGRNVVIDNGVDGVQVQASSGVRIAGNLIGVTAGGASAGNGISGVALLPGTTDAVVGGTTPAERNVIVDHPQSGVHFVNAGSNRVEGNYIGVGEDGSTPIPNLNGVFVLSAPDNVIGGDSTRRNVISGNTSRGVAIANAGATGNEVSGNLIGHASDGATPAPNGIGVNIGDADDNTVGGTTAAKRNVIGWNATGVVIENAGTTGNAVQGNYIGLDAAGLRRAPGRRGVVVQSGASGNTIGGNAPGAGNLIAGNLDFGVAVWLGAADTAVQGNTIGLGAAGTSRGNGTGVIVGPGAGTDRTLIGGRTAAERNVISGNDGSGMLVSGPPADTRIEGNLVGTDASGTVNRGNGAPGLTVDGTAMGTVVGGSAPGAGNTIAFNESGVELSGGAVRSPIRRNRIFSNVSGLGLDLKGSSGVTPNDQLDVDGGPNETQNYPVVESAATGDGTTEITGVLDSAAGKTYTVDLYANAACDPSGHGEGERPLGSVDVTTDGSGHATFAFSPGTAVPARETITATATTPDGSTSEFSACRTVVTPPPPAQTAPPAEPPRTGPPPQPAQAPPPATRPPSRLPTAALTAPRRLRIGQVRAIAVTFAPDSDGDYRVGGVIAVPGLKGKARELKARSGSIKAGQAAKIKLIPPRKLLASARAALRRRKSLTAQLSVTLRGPDGQVRTLKRTIQIVR